jgi:pteridine reductase
VSNPVALVTGSGRKRVGWHVANALAGRGYDLAIHYRSAKSDAADTVTHMLMRGVSADSFQADLARGEACDRLVDQVIARFGRIDVVVHAASIWEPKPLEEVTEADVRRHFEANVLSIFLVSRRAGLRMVGQQGGGLIVTIGDWAEARPYLDYPAYFATKGSIPTLTRMLAVELGTRNPRVRVNAVLPGAAMIPEDLPPAERAAAVAATLVRREGSPEFIARAVLSFLDNEFLTGVCLPIDGGRTIFAPGD